MERCSITAALNYTDADSWLPSKVHEKLTNLPQSSKLAGLRSGRFVGLSCALEGSRESVSVLLRVAVITHLDIGETTFCITKKM